MAMPAVESELPERESKFVVTAETLDDFLARADGNLVEFAYDRSRPVAWTRTTYLDTDDLFFYRRSLRGAARRLRIREYASSTSVRGPARLTGHCRLELKVSEGEGRRKVAYEAPAEAIAELVERQGDLDARWDAFLAPSTALAAFRRELRLLRPTPRLTVFYRRRSFRGAGGAVRVTLDEDVSFCLPTGVGRAGEAARPDHEVGCFRRGILEVKCLEGEAPDWLVAAMEDLPPASVFSKYVLGMRRIVGTP